MAAYMKNTAAFVKQIHTVQHFLTEYIQPPLKRKGREFLTGFYIMFYFLEYPRASKAGSAKEIIGGILPTRLPGQSHPADCP